jgi:transposase
VIASVIQDFGLIDRLDTRLVPDAPARITPGEAVAGMILQGLGCAHRPWALTPPFFTRKPLDLLFREDIDAEMFNRCKLGRTLDEASAYGCALLGQEWALAVGAHEGIARRCQHLDTTSCALTGAYLPDSDEPAMPLPHGYATDHRPDLTPAVVDLLGSQAGGSPGVSQSWEGHTADPRVCQERAEALRRACKATPRLRDLVAAATLSCEAHAVHLAKLGFSTRRPATLQWVSQVIGPALPHDPWPPFAAHTR